MTVYSRCRSLMGLLSLTAVACSAPMPEDAGSDADVSTLDVMAPDGQRIDVPTRRDVPNGMDVPNEMDVPSVTDVADALDEPVETDALDAADTPNPFDVPNVADVPDPPRDTGVCSMGTVACPMVGCVNTQTDNNHCGACGAVCPMGQSCAAGVCACNMGTTLCGAVCVDPQSDPTNCGACGTACPPTQFCVAGSCRIVCPAQNSVCGAGAMMTCRNLQTDPANCGACDTRCVTANGSPLCAAGACAIANCNAGFNNCDMNIANGCETNTNSEVLNCGMCGNACSVANGSPSCSGGACAIASCNPGFNNCDMTVANGCETNTNTAVANCGMCGNACTAANGTPACTAGSCAIASCNGGFGNCDMNIANGCETNTNTAIANCGMCGNLCSVANGSPSCSAGMCGLASCNAGFGNCDMNTANGCETNINTAVANCGMCGNACAVANGSPTCTAGACAIAACSMGFGDCDMNVANGCESNTNTNAAHCGMCGNACSVANGTPACGAGNCAIASCNAGFGNCDNNAANGCETNTNTNVAHCGGCGMACAAVANGTTSCAAGVCVPACNMGFDLVGGRCVPTGAAPRPISPLSLGDTSLRRPTLRWELPASFDGAVLDLCRDRACTMVIESLRIVGTSARPSVALSARSVVFWRLRGTVGAGTSLNVSPTWLFHVPAADASGAIDTSYNPHLDLNGDGLDDLVVGSALADPGGRANAGTASVYHGSAMGLPLVATRVLEGVASGDRFGISVAGAGDVNGDGFGDLIVGASLSNPGARTDAGTATLYLGSAVGVAMVASRVLEGVLAADNFGASVGCVGDIDADGYADLAVGAPLADPGARTSAGTASIFHGSAAGIAMAPTRLLEGAVAGDQLGISLANGSDFNGDGFADLVVGAFNADPGGRANAGAASVYHGSAMGIAAMATRTLEGTAASDQFGISLAASGDLDGDGFCDLVVGANTASPGARASAGTASVFVGSAMGVAMAATRVLEGTAAGDQFGISVANVGDSNGDGFADLVVGASLADPGARVNAGSASVFNGSPIGVPMVATRVLEGVLAGDSFGIAVGSAGDTNGDGFADLAVGATLADPGGRSNAGTASVFLGSMMGIAMGPAQVYEGVLASDSFGVSVAFLSHTRSGNRRPSAK